MKIVTMSVNLNWYDCIKYPVEINNIFSIEIHNDNDI